eukprot:9482455-Pyramimonas_sp.AAC.2
MGKKDWGVGQCNQNPKSSVIKSGMARTMLFYPAVADIHGATHTCARVPTEVREPRRVRADGTLPKRPPRPQKAPEKPNRGPKRHPTQLTSGSPRGGPRPAGKDMRVRTAGWRGHACGRCHCNLRPMGHVEAHAEIGAVTRADPGPHKELHRRPQCKGSRGGTAHMSAHRSHGSWPHRRKVRMAAPQLFLL